MNNLRTNQLELWLKQHFKHEISTLIPLTGDAGFRRYFRFSTQRQTFIGVDAPPENSNNAAFVDVQNILAQNDIKVPSIIAADLSCGFFCLSDFGDKLLSSVLTTQNMAQYYQDAIEVMSAIASAKTTDGQTADNASVLPSYDKAFIFTELDIFSDWLLNTHLDIVLNDDEQAALQACFQQLSTAILQQPQVMMHRDFHSRNILVMANDELGIIDFQDAVRGPVIYDLVSLLRDCYIRWPDDKIAPLIEYYRNIYNQQTYQTDKHVTEKQWRRWFDLTGIQRHLKASGIFARLHHRDGKSGYLFDIPLTLSYVGDISAQYPELSFLHCLITERVTPAIAQFDLK